MSYGNSSLPPSLHQQMQPRSANANQTLQPNQANHPLYHQQYSGYGLPQPPYNTLDPNQSHLNSVYGQTNLNKNASVASAMSVYPPANYPPGLLPPSSANLSQTQPNAPSNLPRRPTNPYQNASSVNRPSLPIPGYNTSSLHNLGAPNSNPYNASPYHSAYSHPSSVLPQMPSSASSAANSSSSNELWPGQLHSHQASRLPYPSSTPATSSAYPSSLNRDASNNLYNSQSSLSTYPSSLNQSTSSNQPPHLTNQPNRSYYGQPNNNSSLPNLPPNQAGDSSLQSPFNQSAYSNRYGIMPPGLPNVPGSVAGYPPGYHPSQAAYDQSRLASQFNQQANSSPGFNNRLYGSNNSTTGLQPPINNQLSSLSPKRPTPTPDQTSVLSPMPPTSSQTPDRIGNSSTLSNSANNQQLTSPIGSNILNQQNATKSQPSASSNSLAQLEQMAQMQHLPQSNKPPTQQQQQQQTSPYFSGLNNSANNLPMQSQAANNSYSQYAPVNLNNSTSNYYSQYGDAQLNSQTAQNSMWPSSAANQPQQQQQQSSQLNNSNNSSISKPNTLSPNLNKQSAVINKPTATPGYNLFDNQYNSTGLIDNSFNNSTSAAKPGADLLYSQTTCDDLNKKSLNNSTSLTNLTNNKESQSINESNSSSVYYDKMINQTRPPLNYLNQPPPQTQEPQTNPNYLQPQQSTDPNYTSLPYNNYQQPPQYSTFHPQPTTTDNNSSTFEMGISNNNQQFSTTNLPVINQQQTSSQTQNDSSSLSNSMYDQSFNNQSHNEPYDPYDDNGFANEPSVQSSKKKNKGRPKKDAIEQPTKKEKKPRQPRTNKVNKKGSDKNNKSLSNSIVSSPIVPLEQQFMNSSPCPYPTQQATDLYNQPPMNNMQQSIADPSLNQMPTSNQITQQPPPPPQMPPNELYSHTPVSLDNNLQPQPYDVTSNQDLILNNNQSTVSNTNLIENSTLSSLDSQNLINNKPPPLLLDNNQLLNANNSNNATISENGTLDPLNNSTMMINNQAIVDHQQPPIDQPLIDQQMYSQAPPSFSQPPPLPPDCLQPTNVIPDMQMMPQHQLENKEFMQPILNESLEPTELEIAAEETAKAKSKPKKPKKPKKKKTTDESQLETSTELNESQLEANNENLDESEEQKASATKSKPKRSKKPKKPKKSAETAVENAELTDQNASFDPSQQNETDLSLLEGDQTIDDDVTQEDGEQTGDGKSLSGKKSKKQATSALKPKKPRLKEGGKKKKLPKLALKFCNKKKRRRLGESDGSDVERTPPASPKEGEEDNSNKRRSARLTRVKLKYHEDVDLGISDVDDDDKKESQAEVQVTNIVEDIMIVEKIMASRMGTREIEQDDEDNNESKKEDGPEKPAPTVEVEEFYVKYKNLSYLHCEWRTEEELEKNDKRVGQKLKRYKQKRDSMFTFDFQDDEPFNPDYCEVDRILDFTEFEEQVPDEETPNDKTDTEKDKAKEKDEVKEEKIEEKIAKDDNETEKIEDVLKEDKKDDNAEEKMETEDQQAKSVKEENLENENKIEDSVENKDTNDDDAIKKEDNKDENNELVENSEIKKESDETKENDKEDENNEEDKKKDDKKAIDKEEENKVEKPVKMKTRITRHYLVKWKGLTYDESTWEIRKLLYFKIKIV